MIHKIIIVLICAAVSGTLYRIGGSGIFKGSIAVRRYGCQIPALTAFWFLGLHTGVWYKVFSRTLAGRYVLVVIINQGNGTWKVITAREMTDSERQLYRKAIGG